MHCLSGPFSTPRNSPTKEQTQSQVLRQELDSSKRQSVFSDVMHKAVALRGAFCRSCRQEIIRSFVSVSVSGVSIPRYTRLSAPIHNVNGRKAFSLAPRLWSQDSPSASPNTSVLPVEEEKDAHIESNVSQASSQHIPWYLQEETPSTEPHPLSHGDQLPTLPENPPPILSHLLEYVYKEAGLDSLKLFDLRGLDPPPALGANTIMIIGTARSVKHLNVSADRLCRWLRSSWKLRPYADGLFGRNELKIKLRRRNRRAKIASQAGAVLEDKDDGITTGWICVNVGVVEDSSVQKEPTGIVFEGFGSIAQGTRIVVQMFTEEKRAEVDLEGLWEATLERAKREKQMFSEVTSELPVEDAPTAINRSSSDGDSGALPHIQ